VIEGRRDQTIKLLSRLLSRNFTRGPKASLPLIEKYTVVNARAVELKAEILKRAPLVKGKVK